MDPSDDDSGGEDVMQYVNRLEVQNGELRERIKQLEGALADLIAEADAVNRAQDLTVGESVDVRYAREMRIDDDGNLFITGRVYERGEKPKGER